MSTLLLAGSVHGGDDDIYIFKRRQRQLSGFRECSSPDLSDNAIPSLLSELDPAVLFPLTVFFFGGSPSLSKVHRPRVHVGAAAVLQELDQSVSSAQTRE